MNSIRQRLITLQARANDIQTTLRRWAACAGTLNGEVEQQLQTSLTTLERDQLSRDRETTCRRLQSVGPHIDTLRAWFDYVLETITERLDAARTLLDQGRNHECLTALNDIERRLIVPNRDTLAFATRSFAQRLSPTTALRIAALDAILRSLHLPTIKTAHARGLLPRESMSRVPLAVLSGGENEDAARWRRHVGESAALGRFIPTLLAPVAQARLAEPWNLVELAFDAGLQVCDDLDLSWELAHKLANEVTLTGVSAATAPLWAGWHQTLFGDVFGVMQLGPAYVSGMIETLVGAPAATTTLAPPTYIRWHIMLQTLHLLSYADEARERFNQIHLLCGDPNQVAQGYGSEMLRLVNEARTVAGMVAFSPLQRLGGARVIDVVPPFLSAQSDAATRVRDRLMDATEASGSDSWIEPIKDVAPHLALAGLRLAFDAEPREDAAAQLATRFWELTQTLCIGNSPAQEQEDRAAAPTPETLRRIARRAVPVGAA